MNRTAVLLLLAGVVAGAVATPVLLRLPGSGATAQHPKSAVYRWLDTEITLPDGTQELYVGRIPAPRADRPWEIVVQRKDDEGSQLRIDATTGAVLVDTLSEAYPEIGRDLIASIRRNPSTPGVWPYVDSSPPAETVEFGSIRVNVPDPAAGIELYFQHGYTLDPNNSEFIVFSDGRSQAGVNATTGEVAEPTTIVDTGVPPAVRSAFARLAASAVLFPAPDTATPDPTPSPTPGPRPTESSYPVETPLASSAALTIPSFVTS